MDVRTGDPIEFDSTMLPTGNRGWRSFLTWVCAQADSAESYWFELKSDVDPNSAAGLGKIVKFILSAANRNPSVAERHLGGHAVMVLGIREGQPTGVEAVEDHVLEQRMLKHLGPDGPKWDTYRFSGEGTNEVLVIIVDPPCQGDRPYPCRADGEGINNGDIYVRVKSQSRKANAADHDMLHRRSLPPTAIQSLPTVEVRLSTPVTAFTHDVDEINGVLDQIGRDLIDSLPSEVKRREDEAERRVEARRPQMLRASEIQPIGDLSWTSTSDDLKKRLGLSDMHVQMSAIAKDMLAVSSAGAVRSRGEFASLPEDRTEDGFRKQVDGFLTRARSFASKPDEIVNDLAPAFEVVVTNTSDEPIEDLTIDLHIEGPVELLNDPADGHDWARVPDRPRGWGPRQQPLYSDFGRFLPAHPYIGVGPGPNSVTGETTGSVTLTLELQSLRSHETVVVNGEDVLLVTDTTARTLHGTWEGRARNVKGVLTGDIDIDVGKAIDITTALAEAFGAGRSAKPVNPPKDVE